MPGNDGSPENVTCPFVYSFGMVIIICIPCTLHLQPRKVKNVSYDTFGTKVGQVHMQRQDFSKLQTRKLKGLKRSHSAKGERGSGGGTKKPRLET